MGSEMCIRDRPIAGLIHCSGGAQSKVVKFLDKKRVIKDNLLDIPPLFRLIEEEAKLPRQEMYQVFNMGHRLEAYVDISTALRMIDIAKEFSIEAKVIGYVENAPQNEVLVKDSLGEYRYTE